MNVVLAVNSKPLEKYISNIKEINVVKAFKNDNSLFEAVNELNPHIVIISKYAQEKNTREEVITRIVNSKDFHGRVIYLYGEDDAKRKIFTNFLIDNGIYNFHVGDIDEDVINELLFNIKERKDVFKEELTEFEKEILEDNNFDELEDDDENNELEVHFVEKIEEVERIVKVKEEILVIDKNVITVNSNSSTGKSFLTWVLGEAFSLNGYRTTIINLDKGSMQAYFPIDDGEDLKIKQVVRKGEYSKILDVCYKANKNLSVIAGYLGEDSYFSLDEFINILNISRAKSDVTIVDCNSGINEINKAAIMQSNVNLYVFDLNSFHYNLNYKMLEQMHIENLFIEEKSIAVINNALTDCESYMNTKKSIQGIGYKFKEVVKIGNCGGDAYDLMFSGSSPYTKNEELKKDIDTLIDILRIGKKEQEGLFSKLFSKFKK